MGELSRFLIRWVDYTIHADLKRRGGMTLLRARMLIVTSFMAIPSSLGFVIGFSFTPGLRERIPFILAILFQSMIVVLISRWVRRTTLLAAIALILVSVYLVLGIAFHARSIYAPGFMLFPMLIIANFLMCGRRLGIIVSLLMMLIALSGIFYCHQFGDVLPFGNDRLNSFKANFMTLLLMNTMTITMVIIYFYLMHEGERRNQEQKTWVQRAARMQELVQMSGHFALQTHRPLDILGTALHNMEEPLQNSPQPRLLLPLLESVENSIRDLAAVSKSFSLFSRRFQDEGLEQTSINAIFQHVDTIYNVGIALRRARWNWKKLDADIPIYTQTAKLVMLIISLIRSAAFEDGIQLQADTLQVDKNLYLFLRYKLPPPRSRAPVLTEASSAPDLVFDPELTEHLIVELCQELGIQRTRYREGDQQVYRLKLPQN